MRSKDKSKIQLFVSQKVREFRETLGLTQEQFAEKMNRSRTFVSNRENPNMPEAFSMDFINEVAVTFSCSPKYFFPDRGLK